jgi:glycosyltransferase involved in cell wall biosynthesis
VCILSRKDLSLLTRVVRQAGTLTDAGWSVTVVCLHRPVQELLDAAPAVEYVEVEVDPWTRRAVGSVREWFGKTRRRHRQGVVRGLYRPLRKGVLVPLSAALLRANDETFSDKVTELGRVGFVGLVSRHLHAVRQRAISASFAERAAAAMRGRRIDVCQAHDNYALLAAKRIARESGALLVYDAVEITEHRLSTRGSLVTRAMDRIERREEARIFDGADAMITIGEALADWYERRYGILRPVVVRNCRHYWPYRPDDEIRRDCRLAAGDRLVVWFGHAYPEQGLERTIEAAARMREDVHVALVMWITPRWEEFADGLREQARALGVEGRVHFLPPRDPLDLIRYVSGGDVGLIPRPAEHPNTYFSMPNKFMEMVMARLPIGVSELVELQSLVERYGIGRVFDVRDPAAIARTLEEMLEPEAHEGLRANVMRAAEELCWERESQKYLAVYDRLRASSALSADGRAPLSRGRLGARRRRGRPGPRPALR